MNILLDTAHCPTPEVSNHVVELYVFVLRERGELNDILKGIEGHFLMWGSKLGTELDG